MNLAVSNIAWPADRSMEAYRVLRRYDVSGIEVAPTAVWPEWQGITGSAIRTFRRSVEDVGLRISSLQSILFQKSSLRLFGTPAQRQSLLEHLEFCADIAAELGAWCVVFGAPRNRDRGDLSPEEAMRSAAELFLTAAEAYSLRGVRIAFEANPTQYGCNFATDSVTAARLVRTVNSEGFGLHLDTACLHLAGEDATAAVAANSKILTHFHVSEPNLGPFTEAQIPHARIAESLRGYQHWISLEMRAVDPPLKALERAVRFLRGTYGG